MSTDDITLDYLRSLRTSVLWKADDLGEADLRRPMTTSGTNLLGLVKHLAACEFGYFQMCFSRPVPDLDFLSPDADPQDDMAATEHESAADLLQLYRDAIAASDRTVDELGLDATGAVPWWGGREIGMRRIIVHMAVETARHLGHMDILREQIDGRVGLAPDNSNMPSGDEQYWAERVERLRTLEKLADAGALEHQRAQ